MKTKKKLFKICQAVFFSLILSISIIGLGYIHKPKASADVIYTLQAGKYRFNESIDNSSISGLQYLIFNNEITNYELDAYLVPAYSDYVPSGRVNRFVIDTAQNTITASFYDITGFNDTIIYMAPNWVYERDLGEGNDFIPLNNGYAIYLSINANVSKDLYEWFTANTTVINLSETVPDYDFIYDNGYNAGYQAGIQIGATEDYNQGYNDGIEYGQGLGYNDGYNAGYQAGANTSEFTFLNLFTAVIDAPVRVFSKFLDFEFLGFNVWTFIKGVIGIAIIIFIIKLILGRSGGGDDG